MLFKLLPAEVSVVAPSKIQVDPVTVKVSALVKSSELPAKLTVRLVESRTAVPPVVLNVKLPLISAASAKVNDPEAALVPIVMLLKLLPAEVNVVVPSKIQVDPVVVKVSALVKARVLAE